MRIEATQILVWTLLCICIFICSGCDEDNEDSDDIYGVGPQPIVGVETSIAGFIGVAEDNAVIPLSPGAVAQDPPTAPAGEPQLITSWSEFEKAFGEIQSGNLILAHAVKGFFDNGGKRCWVIRVATSGELSDLTDELKEFESIDEITIVVVPAATTSAQHSAILKHCFDLKDRFAVLDGTQSPPTLTPGDTAPVPLNEAGGYGALYFPWLKVSDPSTNTTISVPPSGYIAGIYARTDSQSGVWKAPANEVVQGVVELDRTLTSTQLDILNEGNVNTIGIFSGAIKVWGARTRSSSPEFRYVNVRRYLNFLQESIDEGTQWVVFEPNTQAVRDNIVKIVSDFLMNQWKNGALFGSKPGDAFFVTCDTVPQSAAGPEEIEITVGVALIRPAEFMIFNIQRTTAGQ